MAFIVFGRPENPFAEQASHFGLEGPVIDGFWLGNLTVRPVEDRLRRSQANGNAFEIAAYLLFFFDKHIVLQNRPFKRQINKERRR
jgi:hypothetical protein